MPIFEYSCRNCGTQFECLVRTGTEPACPKCASADLEKLLSIPAIKSETTHRAALTAAKKRDQKLGNEKAAAQREYELKHND
jgi:putative FmdB family regulatory protein